MNIKKYNQFEGVGSWIRTKFNDKYSFVIDGFNIEISKHKFFIPAPERGGGYIIKYKLKIDDTLLNTSNYISKKVYSEIEKIYKSNEIEEYTLKDAKIRFGK